MPIPDFQTLMRPILAAFADGHEHPIAGVRAELAEHFALTPDELEERLPSGAAKTWHNRCGWATWNLSRVGLLERRARGVYRIQPRGQAMLERWPERIDLQALSEFPDLDEFRMSSTGRRARVKLGAATAVLPDAVPPAEQIEAAATALRRALVAELRESITLQSPAFFEGLVLDVLTGMGYGGNREDAAERLGRSGDGGIDGVIREDRLGLDQIYIQAKRWEKPVGRPAVQGFVGALQGVRASRGVMISSSSFSSEARAYAEGVAPRVVLIDGHELAELMVEHGVGVSVIDTYTIRRIDSDYFSDESGDL